MAPKEQSTEFTAVLLLRGPGIESRRIALNGRPFRIGRASASELSFPENAELSRDHFLVEETEGSWFVRDLNSRNGTMVNGSRIRGRVPLFDHDVIVAGHLSFTFLSDTPSAIRRLVPLAHSPSVPLHAHSRSTDLQSALASESSHTTSGTERAHLRAFVRAGRELVSQRSMDELFQVILDIAIEAAGASRGVVALQVVPPDASALNVRAQRGVGFHLSTAIVNQVLVERKSLLVVDVAEESLLANRHSIVAGQVKSVIAVPLQTEEHTIGLLYVDTPAHLHARSHPLTFTPEDLNLLTVLANVAAIRIEHARLLEMEQQEKLWARDREQAAEIQRSLLPIGAPYIPGYEMAGYNAASRSVGGDYYDFLKLDDGRLALVVADVAGKGMPAALLMSGLQARVQVLFETGENLASHVSKLNRSLKKYFPRNRFVTFFIAALSPDSGRLDFCNAGHNPPMLLHGDNTLEHLIPTGPIIGVSTRFTYKELVAHMLPGDILALYSDGVTEACDAFHTEEFGEERLLQTLRDNREKPPAAIIDAIIKRIASFTGNAPLSDDLTLVILRRLALNDVPNPDSEQSVAFPDKPLSPPTNRSDMLSPDWNLKQPSRPSKP